MLALRALKSCQCSQTRMPQKKRLSQRLTLLLKPEHLEIYQSQKARKSYIVQCIEVTLSWHSTWYRRTRRLAWI